MAIIYGDQDPAHPDDTLIGGDDDDRIFGLTGDDLLVGGGGNDSLFGGVGVDSLFGGDGDDTFTDDGAAGSLYSGGAGRDTLYIQVIGPLAGLVLDSAASIEMLTANAPLVGTDAANLFDFSGLTMRGPNLRSGGGDDTLIGGQAGDRFEGELGNDILDGRAGNDTLVGGGGADTLLGGDGDDLLVLSGSEVFNGGAGIDSARIVGFAANLTFADHSIEKVTLVASAPGLGQDNIVDLTGVQSLTIESGLFSLKEGNDVFIGSVAGERIYGGVGDDTLSGFGGNDTLYGEDGGDSLSGGDGVDLLDGGAGDDFLDGGAGADTLISGGGSDTLIGGADDDLFRLTGKGALEVLGGAGVDTLEVGGAASRLILDAEASVEKVDLNGHALRGTGGDDVFSMTGVTKYVDGSDFALGAGDDRFTGGSKAESVDGGSGGDHLAGGGGADTLTGGKGADTLVGDGPDSLIGGGGDDVYKLDSADAFVIEAGRGGSADEVRASVDYVLDANVENLTLTGRAAIDGAGNAEDNVIVGNAKANVLSGGDGDDTLTGGKGHDTFLFDARLKAGGVDHITDFGKHDSLLLDVTVFADIDAGRLDRDAFVIGRAAHDADDRIIYNEASGKLFYDRDGSGGAEAVEIAKLEGSPHLTYRDIIIG